MARPDGEKHSEAERLGPGGAAGRQHSTPGLQAAPQGLEGPPARGGTVVGAVDPTPAQAVPTPAR